MIQAAPFTWNGEFSRESVLILAQHAVQGKLTGADTALARFVNFYKKTKNDKYFQDGWFSVILIAIFHLTTDYFIPFWKRFPMHWTTPYSTQMRNQNLLRLLWYLSITVWSLSGSTDTSWHQTPSTLCSWSLFSSRLYI